MSDRESVHRWIRRLPEGARKPGMTLLLRCLLECNGHGSVPRLSVTRVSDWARVGSKKAGPLLKAFEDAGILRHGKKFTEIIPFLELERGGGFGDREQMKGASHFGQYFAAARQPLYARGIKRGGGGAGKRAS